MNTTFRKMYTPEEIKAIAGGGGADKLYLHQFTLPIAYNYVCEAVTFNYYSTDDKPITWSYIESKGATWLSKLSYTIPLISNASALEGFPCGLSISAAVELGKVVIKARLSVMLIKSMGTITTKEVTFNSGTRINDNVSLAQ